MKDIQTQKILDRLIKFREDRGWKQIPHIKELNNGATNRSIRTCRTLALEGC